MPELLSKNGPSVVSGGLAELNQDARYPANLVFCPEVTIFLMGAIRLKMTIFK